jgi:hypothetical protein
MRSSMKWNYRRLAMGAAIALVVVITAPTLFAQSTDFPSSTEKIPFTTWLDGKDVSQLSWAVKVVPPKLTEFQRFEASISANVSLDKVDATDNSAKLLTVVRFTDSHGKSYDAHSTYALPRRTADQEGEIATSFTAYLLPGEYKVAMVAYGTASHKRSVTHQTIRVPNISNDPLPAAWNNLPAVEFLPMRAPLGVADGRLNLPLETNRPVRVEVIANITPTYAMKPYPAIYRHNRNAIFPELDVLSQITAANGALDVVALELDNQKIAFEQDGVDRLDASSLWRSLNAHSSAVVDASALAGENREAKFFLAEVNKRITALAASSDAPNKRVPTVVIVLSNLMAFPKGEDLAPLPVQPDCNCQVFYIRTHVVLDTYAMQALMRLPPSPTNRVIIGEGASPPETTVESMPNFPSLGEGATKIPDVDQLEKTLAPLNPRVLDVKSTKDFRKAVATILREAGQQ